MKEILIAHRGENACAAGVGDLAHPSIC